MTPKQKLKELMVFAGVGPRRKIVDLTSGACTARSLSESAIHCDTMKKDFYVYYFIKTHKVRTKLLGGRGHLGGQIGHSKCVLIEKG